MVGTVSIYLKQMSGQLTHSYFCVMMVIRCIGRKAFTFSSLIFTFVRYTISFVHWFVFSSLCCFFRSFFRCSHLILYIVSMKMSLSLSLARSLSWFIRCALYACPYTISTWFAICVRIYRNECIRKMHTVQRLVFFNCCVMLCKQTRTSVLLRPNLWLYCVTRWVESWLEYNPGFSDSMSVCVSFCACRRRRRTLCLCFLLQAG